MLKIMTWKGVKNAKQIYQKILGHPVYLTWPLGQNLLNKKNE